MLAQIKIECLSLIEKQFCWAGSIFSHILKTQWSVVGQEHCFAIMEQGGKFPKGKASRKDSEKEILRAEGVKFTISSRNFSLSCCLCKWGVMEVSATEVTGTQRGSTFYTDENCHLYRPLRKKSETVRYIGCYFNRVIGRGVLRNNLKCPAFGFIDLNGNTIKLTTSHNHDPDELFVDKLCARNCMYTPEGERRA